MTCTNHLSTRPTRWLLVGLAGLTLLTAIACSPGTLPGSPSPIAAAGGGGRYNGTFVTRRVGGTVTINESAQALALSVVLRDGGQLTGQFSAGDNSGTLQGVLDGTLASGTFHATVLLQTARQGGAPCEGRGDVTINLAGVNLSWANGGIAYTNCDLAVSSQANAIAVSPIPGAGNGLANVILTIGGGASVPLSTCNDAPGYTFTVEMQETAGVTVTFDKTFTIEEGRFFGPVVPTVLDMPFTELPGGSHRSYASCSASPGTYQAFFSGIDANGNRIRTATPIIRLGQ